jgi:hypothetical protein
MRRFLIVAVLALSLIGITNAQAQAKEGADRESNFYPWSANPSGCLGLFQHQVAYWPGRVQAYLWKGWWAPKVKWPVSPYDPRANAIVAARMVAAGGWGPWS